ncbi:MAG TPA: endonuclease/exonuclease/phosphatase family protein [Luteimonas sp.]|nr:endonuclease/exonuclease/phosphatase family protein [Luteimonas sp.]HRP72150.1 endonuclease/exonuclease/phosphatase family protein [Luteimonas sp.]
MNTTPFSGCLSRLLFALALLVLGACRSIEMVEPLQVMSFNVRVPVAADGPDRWELRRDLLVETIRGARPDVIGTQELVAGQGAYIVAHLPEYAWFGTGRRGAAGDASDEYMGVFWRRDTLRLLDSGDFWLSDTPEVAGSISWDHLYPRLVTWGLFERIADGRRFRLFNTHLPYRDEDGAARLRGAELILQRLAALPDAGPVILVGDFNDVPDSDVHRALLRTLDDAWLQASRREGPAATFHAFTGQSERRIDWVLSRGLRAIRARTLTDNSAGRYPSDHFPVLVDFDWPESPL